MNDTIEMNEMDKLKETIIVCGQRSRHLLRRTEFKSHRYLPIFLMWMTKWIKTMPFKHWSLDFLSYFSDAYKKWTRTKGKNMLFSFLKTSSNWKSNWGQKYYFSSALYKINYDPRVSLTKVTTLLHWYRGNKIDRFAISTN